jgi:hypothetical protein
MFDEVDRRGVIALRKNDVVLLDPDDRLPCPDLFEKGGQIERNIRILRDIKGSHHHYASEIIALPK